MLRPGQLLARHRHRTFTFELSFHESPHQNVEYDYVANSPLPRPDLHRLDTQPYGLQPNLRHHSTLPPLHGTPPNKTNKIPVGIRGSGSHAVPSRHTVEVSLSVTPRRSSWACGRSPGIFADNIDRHFGGCEGKLERCLARKMIEKRTKLLGVVEVSYAHAFGPLDPV
jgi:hypothetical protein